MKYTLTLILILITLLSKAQLEPECNNIIGQAIDQTSGSLTCNPVSLNPVISSAGTPVTRCFSYQYNGPVTLGYLLVTGQCGPFPLYNTLSYTMYNITCDTIVEQGNIFPFNPLNDVFIDNLIIGQTYIICYHWTANCPQTDACPIIYTSLLPVQLLSFDILRNKNEILITWSTASQLQTDKFIVTKSQDNIHWTSVDKINGAGYSNNTLSYIVEDEEPSYGVTYYKLFEQDYNGNINLIAQDYIKIALDDIEETEYYNLMGEKVTKLEKGLYIIKTKNTKKLIYK